MNQQVAHLSAAEHMNAMHGKFEAENFSAGFASAIGEGKSTNEDTSYLFNNPQTGETYMGVFDGMGGVGEGTGVLAATAAQEALHKIALDGTKFANGIQNIPNHFGHIFKSMQKGVEAASKAQGDEAMGSTALVALLKQGQGEEEGRQFLHVGAVADSLGFVVRKDGSILQLNKEETQRQILLDGGAGVEFADAEGNVVTNGLGPDIYRGLEQTATVEVFAGDVVVLTTDGITGDRESQRLKGGTSNEEVISRIALDKTLTQKERAEALIKLSGKPKDDKTAMIVDIIEAAPYKFTAEDLRADMEQLRREIHLGGAALKNVVSAVDVQNDGQANATKAPLFDPGFIDAAPKNSQEVAEFRQRAQEAHNAPIEAGILKAQEQMNALLAGLDDADKHNLWRIYEGRRDSHRAQSKGDMVAMRDADQMYAAGDRHLGAKGRELLGPYFELSNQLARLNAQKK